MPVVAFPSAHGPSATDSDHTPDAPAYCAPEWVPLDLERHHGLTSDSTLFAIIGLQPPPRRLGLGLVHQKCRPSVRARRP